MNFFERAQIAWATFRRLGGIELPDRGRSSEETLGSAMSAFISSFSTISPVISFEMLAVLKRLWLFNPDVSQYVANIVNLGNPGHTVTVEAGSDQAAASAADRLNESAARLYPNGMGVDGLLNQYLTSVAWSGAISSEDVVNFAAARVEKVVLVPVEQIRFRYNPDTDSYDAYQRPASFIGAAARDMRTTLGLIPLNPETYHYYSLSTVENSPYAKPPATAAVEAILEGQKPLMENIRFMAQKIGLMGLVSASVLPPPKRPGESEGEYQIRAQAYLRTVKTALDGNFNKGLLVTFRDQKIEHTPVTTGAQGVYDVNRMSEEQVFSGLAAMPGFHGRTDATTETFADVVYYLLTAQVAQMQRIVKRRQEQTYRLDLRLGGIDVDAVTVAFNKAHSRNALAEAQTDATKFTDVLARVRAGAITPDEGAQALGYDEWADPELLFSQTGIAPPTSGQQSQSFTRTKQPRRTLTLRFDKASQKYRYQPDRFEIWSGEEASETAGGSVIPFIKKKAGQA